MRHPVGWQSCRSLIYLSIMPTRFLITKIAFSNCSVLNESKVLHIFSGIGGKRRMVVLVTHGCKGTFINFSRSCLRACFMLCRSYDSKIRLAMRLHNNSKMCNDGKNVFLCLKENAVVLQMYWGNFQEVWRSVVKILLWKLQSPRDATSQFTAWNIHLIIIGRTKMIKASNVCWKLHQLWAWIFMSYALHS